MRLFAGTPFDIPPHCERCGKLQESCECPPEKVPRVPPEQQLARLALEKRKKGKLVTVVRGLETDDLADLLTRLKSLCGAGGTVKEGTIEIQGNHLDRVRGLLAAIGYRVQK